MKRTLVALLLLSILSLATSSCKKDSSDDGNYFRCKIDGVEYNIDGLLAYATDFSDSRNIYGVKDNSATESMYLSIPLNTAPGTYTFDSSNDDEFFALYSDASLKAYSSYWGSGSGTITIEENHTTHIKGTFSFNAYDADTETVKLAVTEGSFNVEVR